MPKNFQEFQSFPAVENDKVLDAARAVLARQEPGVQEPCNNLSHPCDNLSHAVTSTHTGPGSRHNPGWQIADDGTLSLTPPYLLICYPSGRLVIRTHADERTMARAHVQAVKPSSVLPPGTRVIAVTRDGARVEKEKAR